MRALYCLILILLGLLVAQATRAHEFYDTDCCNEQDCAPYTGEVRETPQGYYLPAYNYTFPYNRVRYKVPSDDGHQYHLCKTDPAGGEGSTLLCFYAKPGGV